MSDFQVSVITYQAIAHFGVAFCLAIKARPDAQPFKMGLIESRFQMKEWTPRLALRTRRRVIRRWLIILGLALLKFKIDCVVELVSNWFGFGVTTLD